MVNYIKHLESVTLHMAEDTRLNPSHVSMYLALFLIWNHNRFENPLSINRAELMKISKIGSKGTYHRCINDLHDWSYLQYEPSHNPLRGSLIHMFNFGTSSEQVPGQLQEQVAVQPVGQVTGRSINNIKHKKQVNIKNMNIPTIEEIKDFFQNDVEADKFFNYYESNGWHVGKNKMKNWKAAAKNWILNAKKFKPEQKNQYQVNEDKDYAIPL